MTAQSAAPTKDQEAQILDAARDVMLEGGIEAVSMRAVGDRVGVTATALYHYFANKQDLIERVGRRAFERFGVEFQRAAEGQPRGSMARVRALGEAYIRFAVENEPYFRVIFSLKTHDPRTLEDLPGGGGYPILREAIEEAMASGAMRRADVDLVASYLWTLVHGVVTLHFACRGNEGECAEHGVPAEPQALFAAFSDLIQRGLKA